MIKEIASPPFTLPPPKLETESPHLHLCQSPGLRGRHIFPLPPHQAKSPSSGHSRVEESEQRSCECPECLHVPPVTQSQEQVCAVKSIEALPQAGSRSDSLWASRTLPAIFHWLIHVPSMASHLIHLKQNARFYIAHMTGFLDAPNPSPPLFSPLPAPLQRAGLIALSLLKTHCYFSTKRLLLQISSWLYLSPYSCISSSISQTVLNFKIFILNYGSKTCKIYHLNHFIGTVQWHQVHLLTLLCNHYYYPPTKPFSSYKTETLPIKHKLPIPALPPAPSNHHSTLLFL